MAWYIKKDAEKRQHIESERRNWKKKKEEDKRQMIKAIQCTTSCLSYTVHVSLYSYSTGMMQKEKKGFRV
jgi:hypothetical protein